MIAPRLLSCFSALLASACVALAAPSALNLKETEITLRPNEFLKPSMQKDGQGRVDEDKGIWTYTLRAREFQPPVNLVTADGADDPVLELLKKYIEALRAWDLDALKALAEPDSAEQFLKTVEPGPAADQLRKDYAALEVYEPTLLVEYQQPGRALVFSRIKASHNATAGYVPICIVEKDGKLMLANASLARSYALNFLLALRDNALETKGR